MPVAFAMTFVGLLGLLWAVGPNGALGALRLLPFGTVASYSLSVIPLFILMGYFANIAGLAGGFYDFAHKWLGRLPGGLGIASVLGCAAFAATTGSSVACAATMGKVALPHMAEYGYEKNFAGAIIVVAGTLGILIPPSTAAVIYGIITGTSIGKLLIAGIIPGIISALVYAGMIVVRVRLNPSLAPLAGRVVMKERLRSLKGAWGIPFVAVVVLGGLYAGIWTPTEAGAMGAFLTLCIAIVMRKLSKSNLSRSLYETLDVTILIFLILIGSFMFSQFLTLTGLPQRSAEILTGLPNRWMLLSILIAIYFLLGMFIDGISIQVLTLPILFPVVVEAGFDPVWFGIVMIKLVEIALASPPFGMNLFVILGMDRDMRSGGLIRQVWPLIGADFITVGILVLFPQIVLFLPHRMG